MGEENQIMLDYLDNEEKIKKLKRIVLILSVSFVAIVVSSGAKAMTMLLTLLKNGEMDSTKLMMWSVAFCCGACLSIFLFFLANSLTNKGMEEKMKVNIKTEILKMFPDARNILYIKESEGGMIKGRFTAGYDDEYFYYLNYARGGDYEAWLEISKHREGTLTELENEAKIECVPFKGNLSDDQRYCWVELKDSVSAEKFVSIAKQFIGEDIYVSVTDINGNSISDNINGKSEQEVSSLSWARSLLVTFHQKYDNHFQKFLNRLRTENIEVKE